ncbi:ferredoxin family protein [uncultured Clostridium sp.]|uniref:4Fe-4S dicluster domain-containing protein n=1 Tax=uncultured Clostridium sp. TaxID=59620 RepID=UPI0025F374AB|nr:ferredoxin family protein [uncultured Clostridium sp.]
MSIKIDKSKCIGCKLCESVCPGNLIRIDSKNKAYIKFPDECWGCASCVKECSREAIKFYLGADIGGRGASLKVKKEGDILHWKISKDDYLKIIDVDKNQSNKY